MANNSKNLWIKKHLSDSYVKKAKLLGFRSRAAFKLIEIDKNSNLIKPGISVLDLGAAPGSWSQVVSKKINLSQIHHKKVIAALDLLPIQPIDGVKFIQGDFTEVKTIEKIVEIFNGEKIDLILSDISPTLSGINAVDAVRINELGELVLDFCKTHLSSRGCILVKTFHGSGHSQLIDKYKKVFSSVFKRKPDSSRSGSAEVFVLAKNLRF